LKSSVFIVNVNRFEWKLNLMLNQRRNKYEQTCISMNYHLKQYCSSLVIIHLLSIKKSLRVCNVVRVWHNHILTCHMLRKESRSAH